MLRELGLVSGSEARDLALRSHGCGSQFAMMVGWKVMFKLPAGRDDEFARGGGPITG